MAAREGGDNFNRYAYAFNNPYKFTDPDGRDGANFYSNPQEFYRQGAAANPEAAKTVLGLLPVTGTIIAIAEAIQAPTLANVAVAAVSVIPEAGGVAAEALRGARVAEGVAKEGAAVSRLKPGPFAGESIPARSSSQTFNSSERAAMNRIGGDTGCHSCGSTTAGTKSGNFVPDHQPVSSLNSTNAPQRLYPQCLNCSRQQGLEAARELRKQK